MSNTQLRWRLAGGGNERTYLKYGIAVVQEANQQCHAVCTRNGQIKGLERPGKSILDGERLPGQQSVIFLRVK